MEQSLFLGRIENPFQLPRNFLRSGTKRHKQGLLLEKKNCAVCCVYFCFSMLF